MDESMNNHEHDCNDPQCEDHYAEICGCSSPENNGKFKITEFVVSPEVAAAADAAISDIRSRSFAERNRLGKMMKCQVCKRRHRQPQCVTEYKELWMDEDIETGERTIVYATVPLHNQNPTIKAVFGAAQFKGKRRQPRPSHKGLLLVSMTRALFPSLDGIFEKEEDQMKAARAIAEQVLALRKKAIAKRKRIQSDVSRRINRGLLRPGTRTNDRRLNYVR